MDINKIDKTSQRVKNIEISLADVCSATDSEDTAITIRNIYLSPNLKMLGKYKINNINVISTFNKIQKLKNKQKNKTNIIPQLLETKKIENVIGHINAVGEETTSKYFLIKEKAVEKRDNKEKNISTEIEMELN
ncbi:hypothetical protein AYI69_g7430 [Smittium culicis]|uniref:Uncharacterized protein n=1 Tax=Smittium culicis TaxID=133412 RepID=A0A1R1XS14_9FUNG|nr:hypothetical protein AYI69_g7430 [Smittium culicis]